VAEKTRSFPARPDISLAGPAWHPLGAHPPADSGDPAAFSGSAQSRDRGSSSEAPDRRGFRFPGWQGAVSMMERTQRKRHVAFGTSVASLPEVAFSPPAAIENSTDSIAPQMADGATPPSHDWKPGVEHRRATAVPLEATPAAGPPSDHATANAGHAKQAVAAGPGLAKGAEERHRPKKEGPAERGKRSRTRYANVPVPELRRRVEAMYAHYDPGRIDAVEELFERLKGREAKILSSVIKRFGPEPTDADTQHRPHAPAMAASASVNLVVPPTEDEASPSPVVSPD
jgi:hypothetical protein